MNDEEKRLQRKRINAFVACRKWMEAKMFDQAHAYATARGFTMKEAVAGARRRYPKPPKDWAPPGSPVPAVVAPLSEPVLAQLPATFTVASLANSVNGWPLDTDAIVWNHCRNRKMVMIQLPDGRFASMWIDRRRNWRLGSPVKVHLDEATADPLYIQVVE